MQCLFWVATCPAKITISMEEWGAEMDMASIILWTESHSQGQPEGGESWESVGA